MIKSIIFIFLVFNTTYSQWEQVSNGLFGGSISNIAVKDSTVYAGTYNGGIFTSTNWCKGWTCISDGLSSINVNCITTIDNYLFAATEGEINFTSNNGNNWYITNDKQVEDSYCISSVEKNILAGDFARGYGILLSSDFGISWRQINNDSCCKEMRVISALGNKIFSGGWNGLFFSTNTGQSWVKCFSVKDYHCIEKLVTDKNLISILAFNPDTMTYRQKIYISSNSGVNWIHVGKDIEMYHIFDIGFYQRKLYASSDSNLFVSNDFGRKWIKRDAPKNMWHIFTGQGHIIGSTYYDKLFVSSDDGATWQNASNGMTGLYIGSVFQIGRQLIAGSQFSNFISQDDGQNWSSFTVEPSNYFIKSIIQYDNILFAGIKYKGVFKSTNKGRNWFPVNNGIISRNVNALLKVNNYIYAALGDYPEEDGGVYRLNVNDSVWQKISGEIPDNSIHSLVNIDSIVFAGTHRKGIYKTTNGGVNWTEVNNGFGFGVKRFETMAVQNNKIFAGKYSDGLFTSTDLGESWNICPLFKERMISFVTANNTYVFTASYHQGIFISKDSGFTWENISNGLLNLKITSLLIYNDYLYAGTNGSGVWRHKLN